jgi:hypothetical protein
VPESVGGIEADFLEYLAIVQAIAKADGSTAWCFNQNNVLGTMASLMPESLAKEVWADPHAILSNGPPQNATVTQIEGGYSLTGRWNFSSGSRHATWVMAVGRVSDTEILTMLIPRQEVEFIDTWQVNGLRGTGSFSFEAKNLFIPVRRSFIEAPTPREWTAVPDREKLAVRSRLRFSGIGSSARWLGYRNRCFSQENSSRASFTKRANSHSTRDRTGGGSMGICQRISTGEGEQALERRLQ